MKTGKLDRLFKRLMVEPDWEWLFIDGTHIRGHQHGTGIADQVIGKTKGGNTTKIHLVVEAKGHPVNIEITKGTTAEVQMARLYLAATQQGEVVCADKGDDADALREGISRFGS